MRRAAWRADLRLLLAAAIWGTAFVAQRAGMAHVGPLTFNGVRFALGGVVLVGWMWAGRGRGGGRRPVAGSLVGGVVAGVILFLGAGLQQAGLVYTTAGKAGFITGLYVVLVPFLGIWLGQRPGLGSWAGAGLAVVGLYLLSVTGPIETNRGDVLVLASAFFWAAHILVLAWLAPRMDPCRLAAIQSFVCSGLSLGLGMVLEPIRIEGILAAGLPILYGGVMSVGVGYTLQVVAQKDAPPVHVAILLSLEAVFAAFAGWLLLGETLTDRALLGAGLMLAGMLVSQLWKRRELPASRSSA